MPSIGHIVLAKKIMKNKDNEEVVLVDPFSVLTTNKFPFSPEFSINIGVFSLKPGVTYQFSYLLNSPSGEKVTGNIFDIQADPNNKHKNGIDFNLTVNMNDVKFEEAGVYNFRFQIINLHEEKSTFFLIKEESENNEQGDKNE